MAFGEVISDALCPENVIEYVSPAVSVARLSRILPEPDVVTSGPFGGDANVAFNSAGLESTEFPCVSLTVTKNENLAWAAPGTVAIVVMSF